MYWGVRKKDIYSLAFYLTFCFLDMILIFACDWYFLIPETLSRSRYHIAWGSQWMSLVLRVEGDILFTFSIISLFLRHRELSAWSPANIDYFDWLGTTSKDLWCLGNWNQEWTIGRPIFWEGDIQGERVLDVGWTGGDVVAMGTVRHDGIFSPHKLAALRRSGCGNFPG